MRTSALVVGLSLGPIGSVACGPGSLPGTSTSETSALGAESETGAQTETSSTAGDTDGPATETGGSEPGGPGESETETGEPCIPGELDCECLPDGTCLLDDGYFIGCTGNGAGTCQSCGYANTIVSGPCEPASCPIDCKLVLEQLGIGPLNPFSTAFTYLTDNLSDLPYLDDCAQGDGWTWLEPGVEIELCGQYCEAWMQPALEGTSYTISVGCPPGG